MDLQESCARFAELRRHLDAGGPWIDPMAYELLAEISREVVPRSVAEALAEALETAVARLRIYYAEEGVKDALAEYRAAYPKETP